MFEELIGKTCRIQKSDGYIKIGTVLEIEEDFIKLLLPHGNVEYILIKSIQSISEVLD